MKQLSRNEVIAVAVSLVVIALFFVLRINPFQFMSQQQDQAPQVPSGESGNPPGLNFSTSTDTTLPSGLGVSDTVVGSGPEAQAGSTVTVHYVGALTDGTIFDASYVRGEPFSFVVGQGSVIQGWEQGLLGMKAGGRRRLVIPPNLGYGAQAVGPIPANSTLIFEIELLEVN